MSVQTPKKIAVIGGGISGMGAAYALAPHHRVTLFEASPRLGGHARTIIAGKNKDQPVDTGFIVFNRVNYPHLTELFSALKVPVCESNMSFCASIDGGRIEYGLARMDTLFAQRKNILNPAFLRMLRDIVYFNNNAARLARPGMTIGQLLGVLGTGNYFRDHYITPFSGAIWSTPLHGILDFPADALIRFFKNHGLMSRSGQHQWYTVKGGSGQYVSRLEAELRARGADLRLGSAVKGVARVAGKVEVHSIGATPEIFDAVVFATHSDDSLRLLTDPSAQERDLLGAIKYQPNEAVLHCDHTLMPKSRKTWSSWAYTEPKGGPSGRIDLTYWMNSLQPIPHDDPHFVTLNGTSRINPDKIYDATTFRHPVYDTAAIEAQSKIAAMNGAQNTWYCGAWMRNGFHEDGLASALDVARALNTHGQKP